MPTHARYPHGAFSWIELTTTDASRAKTFYAALFGWTYDDQPVGPGQTYTMVKVGEHHVAGLFQMGAEMAKAMPPTWASYVTVDDVDAVAAKVKAEGGAVLKEPFDVMDAGRMAVVQDPTGAAVCLWQAKAHIGSGVKNEPGSLCWNELYTTDPDKARAFYTKLFGWNAESVDMGPMGIYTLFKLPGAANNVAGMMKLPAAMAGAPSHWTAYLEVVDCDASTKEVADLGGTILMPPTDIPDVGRFSIVQDPMGATFALYKNAH